MARPAFAAVVVAFSMVFLMVLGRSRCISGQERLEQRFGKKPPKPAVEAEKLLERSELPKLADFYRALVDAYPGVLSRLFFMYFEPFLS